MANDNIYIYDAATGNEIIRPMTDEEQAIRDAEIEVALAAKAEKIAAASELEAKKLEVLEKLGLTADEVAALLA